MGAEAGHAAGAVGRATHCLVEQVLVPQGFEHPPARLDVIVVQSDVWVVHVYPVTDAISHGLPLFHVAEDTLPTFLVELFDSVFLDVPFALKSQFLLDL